MLCSDEQFELKVQSSVIKPTYTLLVYQTSLLLTSSWTNLTSSWTNFKEVVCFRHFFQTNQLSFYYEDKQNKPNIKPIREGKRFGFCLINSENKPNFSYMEENVFRKKKPPGCPPRKKESTAACRR